MINETLTAEVKASLDTVSEALHISLAAAISDSKKRLTGIPLKEYPHLFPLMVRVSMREDLKHDETFPWPISGNSARMAQLILTDQASGLKFRLLKETRGGNGVPHAGKNFARRQVWDNGILEIFADEPSVELPQLLLLWNYDHDSELMTLRAVHPIETGKYNHAVACDVDITVEQGGLLIPAKFGGDSDHRDFFIDFAENEGEEQ